MTTMPDTSIYADSAQARAMDRRIEPKRTGHRFLLTDEEIAERHAIKVARDAEEARRSRARVRGALAQLTEFFGSPAPAQPTLTNTTGATGAPRPEHEISKSIAA